MNDYKYVKVVEDDIEEYKKLIETYCNLPDVIHKVSVTSDYLRGLKANGQVNDMTYNKGLADIAWRKCRCEHKR